MGNLIFNPLKGEFNIDFWSTASGKLYYMSGNVGIGTTNPLQKLDITGGSFRLDNTTGTTPTGIIYKGTVPFISDFNYGSNGTVTTAGANTFVGINAGNLSMGSTATAASQSSYNTAVGYNALHANTTGYNNSAQGWASLQANTTGSGNSAQGYASLYANTTGNNNSAQGVSSLQSNTTGNNNSAQGMSSLNSNTTGSSNSAVGFNSGRFIADGATANATSNNSTYLGANTRALASGDTNETVIGYGAIGNGSNTITLGGTGTTGTIIPYGNVGIGTTVPSGKLNIRSDSASVSTSTLVLTNASGGNFNAGPGLFFQGYYNQAIISSYENAGSYVGGNLQLQTYNHSGILNNGIVLNYAGNLGIGTTNPGSKLTVSGHIGTLGTIPTLTSAGTGATITTGSTDTAGEITEGTLATGAVITFATAYTNIPFAIVVSESGLSFSYNVSTTAITITNIGALSSTKLSYQVIARE